MKKLIYLFAVAATVFAVSCSLAPATPGEAALNIYQLMADGKYEAVAEEFYFDSTNAEEVTQAKEAIASLLKEKAAPEIESKGGIANLEVLEEVIAEDGQSANVTIKTTYGNGESEENTVELVKDPNGDWKGALNK